MDSESKGGASPSLQAPMPGLDAMSKALRSLRQEQRRPSNDFLFDWHSFPDEP
jgi:hypothetical protein